MFETLSRMLADAETHTSFAPTIVWLNIEFARKFYFDISFVLTSEHTAQTTVSSGVNLHTSE